MIYTTRDEGNDYWDWISRNGHIGYVNVLAWMALRAAAEVAYGWARERDSRHRGAGRRGTNEI